jgi:hypothetical protein
MEGEAERPGQGAPAVTYTLLEAVALLGAAAQIEVDHRTDGPEGSDLVEVHVEGLRRGGHVTQVTHDIVE